MMRASHLQFVGLYFVLLLAGSEAARMKGMAAKATARVHLSQVEDDTPETPSEAEATLQQEEKEQCTWRLRKLGCHGNCSFRPLPLDRRLSDSCRLSPEYMLRSEESTLKYAKLESKILADKADRFSETCSGSVRVIEVFGRRTMRCLRRGAHMMQATRFMLKCQEMVAEGNASMKVVESMEYSVQSAKESLAKTLGDDAVYYTMLSEKVSVNTVEILKAPQKQMKLIVGSVAGLVNKDEAKKELARNAIAFMPTREAAAPTREDIEELKKLVGEQKDQHFTPADEVKGLQMLDNIVPSSGLMSATRATALLQQGDGSGDVPSISLVKILLVVLVFVLIVVVIQELFRFVGIWNTLGFLAPVLRLIVVAFALWFLVEGLTGKIDIALA